MIAAPTPTNGSGLAIALRSSGSYRALIQRIGRTSVSLTGPRMTSAIIAGTKVSDSTKAQARAIIRVVAMGAKVLPSMPWKVSNGAKTRKMIACP